MNTELNMTDADYRARFVSTLLGGTLNLRTGRDGWFTDDGVSRTEYRETEEEALKDAGALPACRVISGEVGNEVGHVGTYKLGGFEVAERAVAAEKARLGRDGWVRGQINDGYGWLRLEEICR